MAAKPSDAEFAQWLKPGDALKLLPADWPEPTKRRSILKGIGDDSIRALAQTGAMRDQHGVKRSEKMAAIDQRLWDDPWVREDRDFWTAGNIEFWIPRPTEILFHAGLDRQPEDDGPIPTVMLTDVRIEPESFARKFAAHLPANEPRPDPPTDNAGVLSAEEFLGWLMPPDALARLDASWSSQTKIDWIMSRLRSGRLKAGVEDGEIQDQLGTRPISREVIPARLWKKPWNWTGSTFWQTGDITFFSAPADIFGRPIPGIKGDTAAYQGVRFDPTGLPAAKPEPYNPNGPPTAAEFEEWLHPSDVHNYYYQQCHDEDEATAKTIAFLSDGFLQAAAGQLVINGKDLGLALIPREMWEAVGRTEVWVTGRFRLAAKTQSISGYDVRIDPRIRTLPRPEAARQSAAPKAPETKRLSDGRLAEWAKLFFAAQPDATEKEARHSLATMFPDNSVSRERLRAVMPPRRRGRPLKTKEQN